MLQLSLAILTTLTLSLSYVSSLSLLLLLLSAVSHNASVRAPMEWLTAVKNCMRL